MRLLDRKPSKVFVRLLTGYTNVLYYAAYDGHGKNLYTQEMCTETSNNCIYFLNVRRW